MLLLNPIHLGSTCIMESNSYLQKFHYLSVDSEDNDHRGNNTYDNDRVYSCTSTCILPVAYLSMSLWRLFVRPPPIAIDLCKPDRTDLE